MSKKILCLVLTVVMLALAVPVMATAVVADEPVYSTSFGTINNDERSCMNLPTIDENGVVSYHGNWTPVVYDRGAYGDPDSALIMDADCSQVGLQINGSIGPAQTIGGGGSASLKIYDQAYGGNTTY